MERAQRIERVSAEAFAKAHLAPGIPVIVTGAMADWPALEKWTPEWFAEVHGERKIPTYGTYFDFRGAMRLRDYVERYLVGAPKQPIRYARWFTLHQRVPDAQRFPWADEIFVHLRDDWRHPSFLPTTGYLFPFTPPGTELDIPSGTTVPSKALYLSPAGAVTNLHLDYWGSDAMLVQVHGRKEVVLYAPEDAKYLVREGGPAMLGTSGGRHFADIKNPDLEAFPDFAKARPVVHDTLEPGEIAYIPMGWLHHVDTLTTSITLTWNFAHSASFRRWFEWLQGNPPAAEIDDIRYILHDDPHRLM
ncbi:MAG: cupin-like domain-containing protein [Myxococcota bacterium]